MKQKISNFAGNYSIQLRLGLFFSKIEFSEITLPTSYHIFSSLWSSIKSEFQVLSSNVSWLVGDGENINFWKDPWCGTPLFISLNLPQNTLHSLCEKVSDFISNFWRNVPFVQAAYPNINQIVNQVTLPSPHREDRWVWNLSNSGDLTFKDEFLHKSPHGQASHWANTIWSVDIPPSKSLTAWRLMHGKLPTDENLMTRCCSILSICNNCLIHSESSFHLFFECLFALKFGPGWLQF